MASKKSLAIAFLAIGIYLLRQYNKGAWCYSEDRIDGKVVVITGANTGIGRETALDLVRRGGEVVLACRSQERCSQAQKYIIEQTAGSEKPGTTKVMKLDLSSLKSVKTFADNFKKEFKRLNILINNAGIAFAPYSKTKDGFESVFGVNHLGHFYLTNLLLDMLISSAPSRVVTVSSMMHKWGTINFDDLMSEKGEYSKINAYTNSKLANILFSRELATKLKGKGVTTYALHPGSVSTESMRYVEFIQWPVIKQIHWLLTWPFLKDATEGSQTTICCAVNKKLANTSGKYYDECREKEPDNPQAMDDDISKRLWDISAQLVGLKEKRTS